MNASLLVAQEQREKLGDSSDCNHKAWLEYVAAKKKERQGYKAYAWAEIVEHDTEDDCWIVIHGKVYDVTKFLKVHPG
jgi:cytochrome b involved in lipid metabolism